ncbi:hypothetical protein RB195_005700 [Necator americanus]|uniref:Reverse transcriptase domain-containing protein n=1 Tax=Necator americanus TaxID=51031 RepID=A0ABR1BSH9_NECAM
MLAEFDEKCRKIGLQLNLEKTMFMRDGRAPDAPFTLSGRNIFGSVYVGREPDTKNVLTPKPGRRKRAAWGAPKSIKDVVKRTKNIRLPAHIFNTTVLSALTYASKTWAFCKQEENAISIIERGIEEVMLGVTHFTQLKEVHSYVTNRRSETLPHRCRRKESKIRWAAHVMGFNDNRWTRAVSDWIPRDIKRTA